MDTETVLNTAGELLGQRVVFGGVYRECVGVVFHVAGKHDGTHVKAELDAMEWVADNGDSRWSGVRPDGTFYCAPAPLP